MSDTATPQYLLSTTFLRVFFRVFNRSEVTGRGHVPKSGGVLLIANHTSYVDPPIIGAVSPRPVHFMAKAQLLKIPLLGGWMSRSHTFPVRRGTPDRAALRHAIELLRDGKVLLVFPEGSRSPDGRLQPFEDGAAFIALSARARVVPAGIIGARRVLPLDSPVLRPAKLRVQFGPALDLSEMHDRKLTRDMLEDASRRMEQALRAALPPELHPAP